jgi:hypothetical protein
VDLHEGGARRCIAGDLPVLKVRRIGLEALKVHKMDHDAFERLVRKSLLERVTFKKR